MSVHESILVALFVIAIVFAVLISLSIFLKLQTSFFNLIKNKNNSNIPISHDDTIELSTTECEFNGVDEETIAIILTSISHTSNISLKSLKIKSIKLLD